MGISPSKCHSRFKDTDHRSALQAATHNRHREVVKNLFKAGADMNVEGVKYGTALQQAACSEVKEIVECLLYAGADVNARRGPDGDALQAAVTTSNCSRPQGYRIYAHERGRGRERERWSLWLAFTCSSFLRTQ